MTYTFLDLACEVLQSAPHPFTYQEIWEKSKAMGLVTKMKTSGKTPWASLGSRLYVDVRDNQDSIFIKVGKRPTRFFLKKRRSEISTDAIEKIEKEEAKKPLSSPPYKERDLHPLLSYFANANPGFNRERSIYTKTIFHEGSRKTGYSEWVHPDMVGFYLPIDDWCPDVIEFNRLSDNNSIRLFSFELKRSLNKSNYREYFFQTVSNSSWAHEGYLVVVDILQNDDFLAELERLAASFGIGIIQLDLHDIDSSSVLYPARKKQELDWETINKLCDINKDFEKFIQDVKIDFESRRIHRSEYDAVLEDPENYLREKFNIEQ